MLARDIMLAWGLSAGQVVAIGKRTSRRRKWLRKLAELNPEIAPLVADQPAAGGEGVEGSKDGD